MTQKDFDTFLKEIKEQETSFFANTNSDRYYLEIKKSKHRNFTDIPLYYHQESEHIDRHLAHKIINAYTLAFFDKYLKGKPVSLLSEIPSKYKEVEFKRIP